MPAMLLERTTRAGDPDSANSNDAVDGRPRTSRWRVPVIALVAAVIALAVVKRLHTAPADIEIRHGTVYARGALAQRLDTALAAVPEPSAAVVIGLSFRDEAGRVCRSFASAASHTAGLACREGDAWVLPILSRLEGDAAPATLAVPADLRAAIDARVHGDAFDARQERDARDAGWR